jgi:hypothetical protein
MLGFPRPFFRRPDFSLVPPKHGNEPATALQHSRRPNLDVEIYRFYLNDSPSLLLLKHPPTKEGTARPMAGAKDLPGLATTFTLMVTLLGGPTSTPPLYVPAPRLGIVSARQDVRFLGHETRSVPLSLSDDSSRFGTVSIRIHFQALSRRSWLSFSPPVFSTGRRDWLSPGCIRRRMQAPHGSQVERACWP